jgi:hypothetical protein
MIFVTLNLHQPTYQTDRTYGDGLSYPYGSIGEVNVRPGTRIGVGGTTAQIQTVDPIVINIASISVLSALNAQPGTCYVYAGQHNWHVAYTKEQVMEKIKVAIEQATTINQVA